MSGLFGSTTIKGTRITDFSGTSAEVGRAIPFGHGAFPVDGFIGWAPLPPVEHRQVKRQGKGGVKQETFTYTLSYAVFFCWGQIFGVKWIKRNGKVVYTTDPSAPLEDQEYSAKWAQRVNFHWGTMDQLPDSLIESYEGVGNVSAFRKMFYISIEDEDVTDNGGAPPNYEACVIATPPQAYLTSLIYPQKLSDRAEMFMAPVGGNLVEILKESGVQPSHAEYGMAPTEGELKEPPPYLVEPSETAMGMLPTDGELKIPPPGIIEDAETEYGLAPTAGRLAIPPQGTFGPSETETGMVPAGGSLRVPTMLDKMQAFWEFESNLLDAHGSRTLTANGTTTYPAGIVGNGHSATGLVYTNSFLPAARTNAVCMGGWFKPSSSAAQSVMFAGNLSGGNAETLYLFYNNGEWLAGVRPTVGSGSGVVNTAWIPFAGGHAAASADYHLIIVRLLDGELSLWVDAVKVATAAFAGVPGNGAGLAFGYPFTSTYNCAKDQAFVSMALTDAEIEWLYNDGAGRAYSEIT